MDDAGRHRRLLRPGDRQPGPAVGHRRPLPRRPRLLRRARLRPDPAGRGGVAPGGQPLLRPPGARAGAPDRADRRLRPALRHQHRLPLRLRLPGDAAGQARRRGGRRSRSRDGRLAGRARRLCRVGTHRARRCLRRGEDPQVDTACCAALDPGRHRPHLHLPRFPLPDLRPPDRRPDDAGDRAAGLLRPRPVPRRTPRGSGGGCRRNGAGVDRRHRARRRRASGRAAIPSTAAHFGRAFRGDAQ